MLVGLDFETYGSVDLTTHGLARYVADPHFQPLIGCVHFQTSSGKRRKLYDFVADMDGSREALRTDLSTVTIAAHNAGFEMAVLDWLGIEHPLNQVTDSAVVARVAGAGSKLEAAAPQLLGVDKMAEGMALIRLFSIPGKYQEANNSPAFDPAIITANPDKWDLFIKYCHLDAELSHDLVSHYKAGLTTRELRYQQITMEMNEVGWPVDVASVQEMQRRYLENVERAKQGFVIAHGIQDEKFFNSYKQLKEWCSARGIKANSFDEAHVSSLLERIFTKIKTMAPDDPKLGRYAEVMDLLETKQIIGGSSLKKLAVILNTVGADGRLRDQYVHCGAGQTLRTTGRSVQLQNLKRFTGEPADMATLFDDDIDWTNDEMAVNLRQVFTSSHPDGAIIVGDFSSVESRGLAWAAGEEWKSQAYRDERDVYKDLATKIYPITYEEVVKSQRQVGKVGELSCGYGAGSGAVQSFAAGLGVEMSEGEAAKLVSDWRRACPKTVQFWQFLDDMLHIVVEGQHTSSGRGLADGFSVRIVKILTPDSLQAQHPGPVTSIALEVHDDSGRLFVRRVFLGCYLRGRNVAYYKPSETKGGDLWAATFVDPKTKQRRHHEIYGGKMAGILTQSLCRELFFQALEDVAHWVKGNSNLTLMGQFHDEIVLDWVPGGPGTISLDEAKGVLNDLMSDPHRLTSFPLAAEIKHDYRYTK